jgi:hypothetical protein
MPNVAAYGSWKSPITSDLVAQSITLSEARFDGEDIYWLEGRPQELGRLVVVRANALDGHATDVTPKPYNARTRVHEYGGASWTVADGDVYFSNFAGGRLYRQSNNSSHLNASKNVRNGYASFCPALSFTTKQASNSSTDQGGGKRRAGIYLGSLGGSPHSHSPVAAQ